MLIKWNFFTPLLEVCREVFTCHLWRFTWIIWRSGWIERCSKWSHNLIMTVLRPEFNSEYFDSTALKLQYTGNSLIYSGLRINWNLKELSKNKYYWTPIKAKYSIFVLFINNHSKFYCHSCFMFTLCNHSSEYFIQYFSL